MDQSEEHDSPCNVDLLMYAFCVDIMVVVEGINLHV
jgi:hypothetical protein